MRYQSTRYEEQSGLDRVRFAEGLIQQLPLNHDGRNTWLMNYGASEEAQEYRNRRGLTWDTITMAANYLNRNVP